MQKDVIYRQVAIDALDIAIERYDEMAEEYQKKADIERNDYMDMRDDAYEARQLAQWLNELKYLRGKIEQLTIKPEQRWIPCGERLPKEKQSVLVTDGSVVWVCDIISTDEGYKWEDSHGYWLDLDEWTAWMPLPKPTGGDME